MNLNLGKKILTQNILINMAGNILPMLMAIFSLPFIINQIGKEQFAILSLAWLFLGYFSILDLGIGRATTKFVLDFFTQNRISELKSLVWTSVTILFFFGLLLATALVVATPYLVDRFLNIPPDLEYVSKGTCYWISIAIPFITGLAAVKGVLEAQQRFKLLNIIKVPASILNYVIPAVVFFFTKDLLLVVSLLSISRILLFFLHYYFCFSSFKTGGARRFQKQYLVQLVQYGGWLTVSNIIGPIMVYFDRFIIGSMLSLTLLTFYSTPYEVVTKLLVIAGSATSVLFPLFAQLRALDSTEFYDYYSKSLKALVLILFPITFFVAVFSVDILTIWLGNEFASKSTLAMQLLALGVFLNSVSAIPFTAIQALSRPEIPAKIHMIELPLYLASLWFFALHFGIAGVALAWMLRNLVDAVAFLTVHNRLIGKIGHKEILLLLIPTLTFFALCFLFQYGFPIRLLIFAASIVLFTLIFWFRVLSQEEKQMVKNLTFKSVWKENR